MTALFLRNRCPLRAVEHEKSSYKLWTTKKPLLANMKVFGCHAFVHIPKEKRSKVDAKAVLCRFLVYSEHQKTYLFKELSTGRVVMSRDAQFKEDTFDSVRADYGYKNNIIEIQDDDEKMSTDNDMESEAEQNDTPDTETDYKLGSKRHTRTQSLEKVTEISQP